MPQLIALCGCTPGEEVAAIRILKARPVQLTAYNAATLVKMARTRGGARSALSPEAQKALRSATKMSPSSVKSFDDSTTLPLGAVPRHGTGAGHIGGCGGDDEIKVVVSPEVRKFLHGLAAYVMVLNSWRSKLLRNC
mmetsp:Transcript_10859/g.21602  ORF Transcript_10859/g.21602 Transcript_10859/m.21602 type:complete len:137 (-) Transcript_10859:790-1200(-)